MRRLSAHLLLSVLLALAACDGDSKSSDDAAQSAHDIGVPDTTGASTDTTSTPDVTMQTEIVAVDISDDVAQPPRTDTTGSRAPATKTIVLPLGETLFFGGDAYLAFWGVDHPDPVTIKSKPLAAKAFVLGQGNDARLTPDIAGSWLLMRGLQEVVVQVKTNFLNEDTFLNFNYSPVSPLAVGQVKPNSNKIPLWVATPTSNAVQRVLIDSKGAKLSKLVRTGAWPTSVARWARDAAPSYLLVTQCGRDSLGFVNLSSQRLEDAILVGNEPAHVIVDHSSPKNPVAYVALSGEDRIAKVDLLTRTVLAKVEVGRDPRAMALDVSLGRLFVASLISLNAHPQGPLNKGKKVDSKLQRDISVIDTDTMKVKGLVPEVGTILRGLWLSPSKPNKLLLTLTDAANTTLNVNADSKPHRHRIAVLDPVKAANSGNAIEKVIDLDHQLSSSGPAPSPYTIDQTPDGNYLVVSLSAGKSLLLLDPVKFTEAGRLPAGHDPRGLKMILGRIWTYAWLDNQLQGFDYPATPVGKLLPGGKTIEVMPGTSSGPSVSLTVGEDPTPTDVRAGQRIFNDAAFSKHGEFGCNNCHVDGLTDGLVWDLLIDGPVNTQAFRNIGGTDPFLWGGQLPTLFDFSREVLKLVGASASGQQMELLNRYMQSVTAPPNPFTLPGGGLDAQAQKGRELFDKSVAAGGAGCADCHDGPLLTNQAQVPGKTKGKTTDVPSLLGVYDTGPWGREGQWTSLDAMVDFACKFTGAKLDIKAFEALTAYVRQLPGDLLYLTSARPLNNAKHVWHKTPVELTFSAVLASGQHDHFAMARVTQVDGGQKLDKVQGVWQVSGRHARFTPTDPLAKQQAFRVVVQAGLEGMLGEKLDKKLLLNFQTGAEPAFDVSGKWHMVLTSAVVGTQAVTVALMQAKGGKVTGVVLTLFDGATVSNDAVGGVVSGKLFKLEPFYVDSSFGKLFIKDGIDSTMKDANADGHAESGAGNFDFDFGGNAIPVQVTWKRLSFPKPT